MTSWPSAKARRVLAALFEIGWTLKQFAEWRRAQGGVTRV